MAPIRLGFIGLSARGWASTDLAPPLFDPLLKDKYTLTAVCTSSAESAKESAAKYSELAGRTVKAYHGKQGYTDIANDPEVDLVAVSVKIPDHYDAVIPATNAGKDVFVEWAPGKDLDETVRIAEAAKAKGIRSLVGAQGAHSIYANKAKELIDSGKIGRVLSTTLFAAEPVTLPVFGKLHLANLTYVLDINNGTTLLTVPIGHFLVVLKHILGEVGEVNAIGAISHPEAALIGSDSKPTGETAKKTSHDHILVQGLLKGRYEGVTLNIQQQAGSSPDVPRFRWTIYGEEGIIEMRAPPSAGLFASGAPTEKEVFLNGTLVELETASEEGGRLTSTGKAWLEFAKGDKGQYLSLEDAADIYRVVDAALTSIKTGDKVVL